MVPARNIFLTRSHTCSTSLRSSWSCDMFHAFVCVFVCICIFLAFFFVFLVPAIFHVDMCMFFMTAQCSTVCGKVCSQNWQWVPRFRVLCARRSAQMIRGRDALVQHTSEGASMQKQTQNCQIFSCSVHEKRLC